MILGLILISIAGYFAKKEYDADRTEWAMFWAMIVGWDLHSIVTQI